MDKAIRDFAKQFAWKPKIEDEDKLQVFGQVVVGGMGGSHLSADLLSALDVEIPITIHRNYGLPFYTEAQRSETLYIASSYSGNTEETIDFAKTAFDKGLNLAVIAVGGKLIQFAEKNDIPRIVLPDTGIQPRSALGFSLLALVTLLGNKKLLKELNTLATKLDPKALETKGKELAKKLSGSVPVIYASDKNMSVAYNWKIKLNETGKIPSFCNVFPELNHNEMTGFDRAGKTKSLSEKFVFLFLSDDADHPQNRKRFKVTKKLYEDRGIVVYEYPLSGATRSEKVFSSLLLADWTAYHTAMLYGVEAEQVPMVEEFKKLIS
ncbi:MAG: bifunctional phosphoglucose/phosphomannose isomerase [Candidatus Pacebacteria bacterium]|nr:bifunctional phosphoglucose/phosphomannose isomerase [Candidatus Paceibacterota bacterium]MDD5357005.1 bifunctional phosphoglucose/phosphomannose isomerase [Candidatus Paceibacterota bacterium]